MLAVNDLLSEGVLERLSDKEVVSEVDCVGFTLVVGDIVTVSEPVAERLPVSVALIDVLPVNDLLSVVDELAVIESVAKAVLLSDCNVVNACVVETLPDVVRVSLAEGESVGETIALPLKVIESVTDCIADDVVGSFAGRE